MASHGDIFLVKPPPDSKNATTLSDARWVVLGGESAGIYRHGEIPLYCSTIATGCPWPMHFMCDSDEQAEEVYALQSCMSTLEKANPQLLESMLDTIADSSDAFNRLLGPRKRNIYAVVKGRSGIGCVYLSGWVDASLVVHNVRGPVFRGFKTLKAAILYMVQYTNPSYRWLRPVDHTTDDALISKLEEMVVSKDTSSSRDAGAPGPEPKPSSPQPASVQGHGRIPVRSSTPTQDKESRQPSPAKRSKSQQLSPIKSVDTALPNPARRPLEPRKFVPAQLSPMKERPEATARPASPSKAPTVALSSVQGMLSVLLPAPLPFSVKNLPTTPRSSSNPLASRTSSPTKSRLGSKTSPVEVDSDDDNETTPVKHEGKDEGKDKSKGKNKCPPTLSPPPFADPFPSATSTSRPTSRFPSGVVARDLDAAYETVCFLNIRDNAGNIIGEFTSLDEVSQGERSIVPSLGHFIDRLLDSFGYRKAFIETLHDAYSTSDSFSVFSRRLKHISVLEADFYWEFIRLPPPDSTATHRIRRVLKLHVTKWDKIYVARFASMPGNNTVERYPGAARHPATRNPPRSLLHRLHRKNKTKTRTPAEYQALHRRREEEKKYTSTLNDAMAEVFEIAERIHSQFPHHTTNKIYRALLQFARKAHTKRRVSTWNAYQSMRAEQLNSELPQGAPKKKINELLPQIRPEWTAMQPEERIQVTKERVEELTELRKVKADTPCNTTLSAFHDAGRNLQSIVDELTALSRRTSVQVMLMTVRATPDHFMRPFIYTTSDAIDDYFYSQCRLTPTQFMIKLEAFCVSGLSAVAHSHRQDIVALRSQCVAIINEKFNLIMHPHKARLNYKNFDAAITARFGIVIERWPLNGKLRSPAEIGSRLELETLLAAWESGLTTFTKLTSSQMAARTADTSGEVQSLSDLPPPLTEASVRASSETATSTIEPQTQAEATRLEPPTPEPSTTPAPVPTNVPADTTVNAVGPTKNGKKRPAFSVFINTDGPPAPKKRKTRADKDVSRGPNSRTLGKRNKSKEKASGINANTTASITPASSEAAIAPPSDLSSLPIADSQ